MEAVRVLVSSVKLGSLRHAWKVSVSKQNSSLGLYFVYIGQDCKYHCELSPLAYPFSLYFITQTE